MAESDDQHRQTNTARELCNISKAERRLAGLHPGFLRSYAPPSAVYKNIFAFLLRIPLKKLTDIRGTPTSKYEQPSLDSAIGDGSLRTRITISSVRSAEHNIERQTQDRSAGHRKSEVL